jgi:hypothetical protein
MARSRRRKDAEGEEMTVEEKKRFDQTMDAGAHKYYVYALCTHDGVPFYIGKGQGDRVEDHLRDALAAKMAEESASSDDALTEEERELVAKHMTEKLQKILMDRDGLQEVVVKWGLTEHEAFMCESSLINLLSFVKGRTIGELTNLVNGHASKPEKECASDVKTKARTVSQFLAECAIERKDVSSIHDGVVAIKINGFYRDCLDEEGLPDIEKVKDAVRGTWKISRNRRDMVKYIFALYHGRVVGIFHVTGPGRTLRDAFRDGNAEDYPKFPKIREGEKLCGRYDTLEEAKHRLSTDEYVKLNDFLDGVIKEHPNLTKDQKLKEFQMRTYFNVDDEIPGHLKPFMNSFIVSEKHPDGFNGQNPICYIDQ